MNNFFSVSVFFVFLLLFFQNCNNSIQEVNLKTNGKEMPVSSIRKIEMTYSDSALLKARIKAPMMETYSGEKEYAEFPKGIEMTFYGPDGEIDSRLTAGYAISYNREEKMETKNNVVLKNNKGETLNTEHLIWDKKQNRIYSNVFTKITSPARIIYGEGFETKGDFSKYKILKIRGAVNLK